MDEFELDELPITQPRVRKEVVKERRLLILDLIKKAGTTYLNTTELAKRYGVGVRQIQKDINWIRGHLKPESLRQIGLELDLALTQVKTEMQKLLAMGDTDTKIRAAALILQAIRSRIDFLESFGLKAKTIEHVNVEVTENLRLRQLRIKAELDELSDLPEEKKRIVRKMLLGDHEDL